MAVRMMPPQSKFPVFHELHAGAAAPVTGMEAWSERVATKIANAIDEHEPSPWHVQNVFDSLPRHATYEGLKIGSMPALPPFRLAWLEYTSRNGCRHAVSVSDAGERQYLVHSLMLSVGRSTPILIPVEGMVWFDDVGMPTKSRVLEDGALGLLPDEIQVASRMSMENAIAVALTAFMFSHCKNVSVDERDASRHERRAAMRAGHPIAKYREVVIDPIGPRASSHAGSRGEDAPTRSLHIARGHFAHYSEDRPLFGKYSGTFWRPAHIRGSSGSGVVHKNYRVRARRE